MRSGTTHAVRLAAAALAATFALAACTGSSPRPSPSPTLSHTATSTPPPALTLGRYLQQVDPRLTSVAAGRPKIAQANSLARLPDDASQGRAHALVVQVQLAYQEFLSVITAPGWVPPAMARQANSRLATAVSTRIEAAKTYVEWINGVQVGRRKPALTETYRHAVALDQQADGEEALFLQSYNPLRARAGLPALPSSYRF